MWDVLHALLLALLLAAISFTVDPILFVLLSAMQLVIFLLPIIQLPAVSLFVSLRAKYIVGCPVGSCPFADYPVVGHPASSHPAAGRPAAGCSAICCTSGDRPVTSHITTGARHLLSC